MFIMESRYFDPRKRTNNYIIDCSRCRCLEDFLQQLCDVCHLPDRLLIGSPWGALNDALVFDLSCNAERPSVILFEHYTEFAHDVLPTGEGHTLLETLAFIVDTVHFASPNPQALKFILT